MSGVGSGGIGIGIGIGTGSSGTCGGSGGISGSTTKAARKKFPRNRSDIGWAHGVELDGNYKKIKCKYCEKVLIGGITRFKHHLAGTKKNISVCPAVPDDVKQTMLKACREIMELANKKRKFGLGNEACDEEDDDVDVLSGKGKSVSKKGGVASSFKRSKDTQSTINQIFKRDQREEACRLIARFFYKSAIPFNCVKNSEFVKMCNSLQSIMVVVSNLLLIMRLERSILNWRYIAPLSTLRRIRRIGKIQDALLCLMNGQIKRKCQFVIS